MNYYIVVEGSRAEKKVYPSWLKILNPALNEINYIDEFEQNNFMIVSGRGYPYYFQMIDDAIEDVKNNPIIDFLVISVDSEDMSYEDKYSEVYDFVNGKIDVAKVHIIIQHYCLETWALGNRLVIRRNPQDKVLREYIRFYNVSVNDPEQMSSIDSSKMNRAHFSMDYLRRTLRDKYRNLTYNKNNPKTIMHPKYFTQIVARFEDTNHILSFSEFLNTFKATNGNGG